MSAERDSGRKDEHVQLAAAQHSGEAWGGSGGAGLGGREPGSPAQRPTGIGANGFDDVRFLHHAFGELALDQADIGTTVLGRRWETPFYINAMTGGSEKTGQLNAGLARAAAAAGVAMASGSLSVALREPALESTFRVIRDNAPESFVFANVSPEVSPSQARRAVEILDADALQIHVNPVQEVVMPEGTRDFRGWLDRIGEIVAAVDVPVVVKEVGFGLSPRSSLQVAERGVAAVDVSGRGGTNFALIENARRASQEYEYLAGWGQSAVESLLDLLAGTAAANGTVRSVGRASPGAGDAATGLAVQVFASGGVRTALDVVRALALGADAVGVSGQFLHVLLEGGSDALAAELKSWQYQVRGLLTLLGAPDVAALRSTDLLITGESAEFARLRGIDVTALSRRSESPTA